MNEQNLMTDIIERAAPSPTGDLHLGHVYSIMTAYRNAKQNKGLFKLRIEDIDSTRCKQAFEEKIIKNLLWLGISWDGEIMRQRNRHKHYDAAIQQLLNEDLLYPCSCTRADIKNAVAAPHSEEQSNLIYPGTCRRIRPDQGINALRLNISKAIKSFGSSKITFFETGNSYNRSFEEHSIKKAELEHRFGDLVIVRKDIGTSYNLAVVIDDTAQGITRVTRGKDLLSVTPIQILLQALLGLKTPIYHHHDLIYEKSGKKMSKRLYSETISSFRNREFSPDEVIDLAFSLKEKNKFSKLS